MNTNTAVDWEEQYKRFITAREKRNKQENAKIKEAVQHHFQNPSREDLVWLENGLKDPNMKWFIVIIASQVTGLSDNLFNPLMDAAIDEVNPSLNRAFIDPCLVNFGPRRVNEFLLDVLETGTPFEQAGAVNAMYWAQIPLSFKMKNVDLEADPDSQFTLEQATEESRKKVLALADIWKRKHLLLLEHFVKSKSVEVQQSIIPSLDLNVKNYPESHKSLVHEAINIAHSHPDDYIRHRVGVQLGTGKSLKPLPHRKKNQTQAKNSLLDKLRNKISK